MMHIAGHGPVLSPRCLVSPLALIDSCVPDLPGPRPEDGPSSISSQMLRVYPTPRVDQDLFPNELERLEDHQDQQQRLQPDEYQQAPAQAPLSQREHNSRCGTAGTQYHEQSSYVSGMNRHVNRQPQPMAFQNPFGSPYYRHAVQAAASISAMPTMGPMTAALYQRQLANAQQNWAPAPACSYGGAMAPMYAPLTSNIMMGQAACASLEFSPLQANLMANPRASANGRTGDSTPRSSISGIRQQHHQQHQQHHQQHHHQNPAQVPAPVPAHSSGTFCLPIGPRRSSQGQYPSLGGWANTAPQQARPPSGGGPPGVASHWPSNQPKSPADSPLTSCLFGRRWRGGSSAAAAQPQPMPPPGVGPAPASEQGPHAMPSRFRPSTASSAGGGAGVGGASFCPPGQLQAMPQAYPRYHRQTNWPPVAPRPPLPRTPAPLQVPTPMQPPAQSQAPTPVPAYNSQPQRKVSFVDGPEMVTRESRHLRPMPPPSPIPEYQVAQPQAQPYHYLHQRFPPPKPTVHQRRLQQQQLQQQQQQVLQESEQPRPTPSQPQQVQQQQAQQQQMQAQQHWQAQQQMQAQATQQLLQAQQQMQQIQWQAQQLTAQAQLLQAQQWMRDQQRLEAQQRVRELQLEERSKAGAGEAAQRKMLSSVKMPCWMRREVRLRMAAENEIQPTIEELTIAAPPLSMAMGGMMMSGMPVVTEPSSGGAGGGGCIQPWLSRALPRSPSPQRVQQPSPHNSLDVPSSLRDITADSQRPSPHAPSLSPRSSSARVLPARESQSALSAASESRSPVAAAMAKAAAKAASCFSPGRSRSVTSPRGRTTEESVAAPPAYSPGGRPYYTTDGSPLHPIEMDLFSTQPFGARFTEPHGIGMEECSSNSSKQWWCGLTCSNGKEGDDVRAAKGTAASSCGGASTIASRFDSLIFPEDSVPEGEGVATAAAEAAAAAVAAVAAALTMDAAAMTPKADATAAVAAEDAAAAVAAVEAALCGETFRSAPVAEGAGRRTPSAQAGTPDATAAVAAADAVAAVAAVEAALAAVNAAGINVMGDNEQAADAVDTAVAAVEAALAVVNTAGTNIAADSAAAAAAVEDAVAAVAAALQAVSVAGGGAVVGNPNAVAAVENTAAAAAAVQAALAVMGTASASDAGAAVTAAAAAESTTAAVEAALAAIKSASSGGASDGPDGKDTEAEAMCEVEQAPVDGAEEVAAAADSIAEAPVQSVPETDEDAAARAPDGDGEIVPADADDSTA